MWNYFFIRFLPGLIFLCAAKKGKKNKAEDQDLMSHAGDFFNNEAVKLS